MPPPQRGLRPPTALRPFLPALLVLFVGSGCAALIYEIVWLQLLQLVIGSSAVSLGVLLGTFMGGMCLGSLLLPRSSRAGGIRCGSMPCSNWASAPSACGRSSAHAVRRTTVHAHGASHGAGGIAAARRRGRVCLLPPTLLMGATLPAIARWVETTPRGVSWLGFFYGGNIAGAVFGCLLAGFYLLRVYDMATATYVAVGSTSTVAADRPGSWRAVTAHQAPPKTMSRRCPVAAAPALGGYLAIALSGMTGLGAEVVWTRLLSLMLGGTVYTFSLILAVFLLGLGIGSSVGSFVARGVGSRRAALGWCQLLLAAAIAWAAYPFPFAPSGRQSRPHRRRPWFTFQLNLAHASGPSSPARLWGASFPLALAAVARRGQDPGRLVGGVYAANTIGAIFGSLVFTLLIMPYLGSQMAQRMLVGLSVLSGIIAILPLLVQMSGAPRERQDRAESSPGAWVPWPSDSCSPCWFPLADLQLAGPTGCRGLGP